MSHQKSELDDLARRLEETGDYKVLRRLTPRQPTPSPAAYSGKFGIMLNPPPIAIVTLKNRTISPVVQLFIEELRGVAKSMSVPPEHRKS